jgi:hypothetical protein
VRASQRRRPPFWLSSMFGLYKALYDYTPQDVENELALTEETSVLYVLDKEDDQYVLLIVIHPERSLASCRTRMVPPAEMVRARAADADGHRLPASCSRSDGGKRSSRPRAETAPWDSFRAVTSKRSGPLPLLPPRGLVEESRLTFPSFVERTSRSSRCRKHAPSTPTRRRTRRR